MGYQGEVAVKEKATGKAWKDFFYICITEEFGNILKLLFAEQKDFSQCKSHFRGKKKKVLQSESCDWHGIHSIVLKELKMYWVSKWFLWLAVFSLTVFFVSGLIGREWILILDMPLDLYLICFLLLLGESIEIIIKNKITGYVNKYNMLGESKDYKEAACLCWSVSEASTVIQTKE